MSNAYEIPKKMHRYLRRLVSEYAGGDFANVGRVIDGSSFIVREETGYDGWDGGQHGHDLVLFVPDHLMGNIPLDDQRDIQIRLTEDLNKAASSVDGEYIADVHFEYSTENEQESKVISDQGRAGEDYEQLWNPAGIRLFISHRDAFKRQVNELASQLDNHGISSFIAHDAIEPDEDWQNEIEKALQSMDAMLAFITDDFSHSAWTNQEIGYALARRVPVISIKIEKQDPVGFIRNRQAITGNIDDAESNAARVLMTLKKRLSHSPRYREWVLGRFVSANSFTEAAAAFQEVESLRDVTKGEIARLVDAFNSNSQLHRCFKLTEQDRFLDWINKFNFFSYAIKHSKIVISQHALDDEMPF